MKRHRALAAVLLLAVACASVGKGDPVVVRTQDFIVNSLTIYEGVICWHDGCPEKGITGHSRTETPAIYKAIEAARLKFPKAWQALKDGLETYKLDRNQDKIQALINAVQTILDTLPAVPTGGK